jgi:hypothetical protein
MSFRTGGGTTTHANEPDDTAYESMPEHPPALKMGIGLCEFVWGIFCNIIQVVTSTIAIMSMVLGGAVVAGTSIGDLMHVYPWAALVGLGISLSIQLFLHKNAQSMGSTWSRLRQIQHFNIKSTHTWTDIKNTMTFSNLYFFLALGADVVSDATFINLYTHNAYVILFWIAFLTGSSTLLMYDGATRIWGAIEDFKDYTAYHERHDPPKS